MFGRVDDCVRGPATVSAAWLTVVLLVGMAFATLGVPVGPARSPTVPVKPAVGSFTVSVTFSPNPVQVDTQANGQVTFSGGTPPYTLWVNNSAPGCGPQNNPESYSSTQNSFTCTPTSTGTFNIHLDAVDSASPREQASFSYSFTVQGQPGGGNGGGGNGTGNGTGDGGFGLPPQFLSTMMTLALTFLAGIFAIAAGVIIMGVFISRRLRQLTEAMAPPRPGPEEPKEPST